MEDVNKFVQTQRERERERRKEWSGKRQREAGRKGVGGRDDGEMVKD